MRTRSRRVSLADGRRGRVRTLLEWHDHGDASALDAPGGVGDERGEGCARAMTGRYDSGEA